jgi:[protein-PII] uridylyltransferase
MNIFSDILYLLDSLNLDNIKEYLNRGDRIIFDIHNRDGSGIEVVKYRSLMMDNLISRLFVNAEREFLESYPNMGDRITIIATGGYGREELNPCSDIDIIFIYPWKVNQYVETIYERILYLLWDIGLDIGYSVRTVKDCINIVNKDSTAKTSIVDSRYIAGDIELYNEYKRAIDKLLSKDKRAFIMEKIKERERRYHKYLDSIYILEPNVKEGEGGLRDLHMVRWIAKSLYNTSNLYDLTGMNLLSENEYKDVERAFNFILRVRNELHYLSKRKNDQLTFEYQEKIAKFLEYMDSYKASFVENFMRDYYANAKDIRDISHIVTERFLNELNNKKRYRYVPILKIDDDFEIFDKKLRIKDLNLFKKDRTAMMKLFLYFQRYDVNIDVYTKSALKDSLELIDEDFRKSREINSLFLSILKYEKNIYNTLRTMHDLRFLGRFIPEFDKLFCKTQHDVYHVYTVDIHTLFAINEFEKLREGYYKKDYHLLTKLAKDLDRPYILILAILFHDIGKGEGKGHAQKGGDIVRNICKRMGLSSEDERLIEFLVRNHLIIPDIAQRRDMHDEKLVIQVAKTIKTVYNLGILYILTFVDLKAVGPDVWTKWKNLLFEELFTKTLIILEKELFAPESSKERIISIKDKVLSILKDRFPRSYIDGSFSKMSSEYILSTNPERIAEHIIIEENLKKEPIITKIENKPDKGYSEITICTWDIPGLFSKIAGVMTANNVNILGAQINTRKNGVIFDVLQVKNIFGEEIIGIEKWRKISKDLINVVEGRIRVEQLLSDKIRPSPYKEKITPKFPTVIEIDNDISDIYTVIDVYTHDRIGLLYSITNALFRMNIYIYISKISTKVDQVVDVFYVKDIFGGKIYDENRIKRIKNELYRVIEEGRLS